MTVKYRLIISVVIATMLAVMFTACTKENGVTAQTSANTLKTAAATSVAKTATTSAKSTTAAATASASEAAGSQIPAEVTETVSEKSNDDENYESVLDEKFLEKFEAALDSGFAAGNIDLGGRTVIIASSSALYDPNSSSAAPAEVYLGQRVKAAEKKYNFKAEYKTDASLTKNFTAQTMAGLKYADLVRTNTSGAIPSYITNNFIFPLDDYIDFELQIIKVNPFMSKAGLWKGKHYGITNWYANSAGSQTLMWNKDILDRLGQPDILDLMEARQWNWGAFLDIAKACTLDNNGDGIIDQWGFASESTNLMVQSFLWSNNVTLGVDMVNNMPVLNIKTPAALRAYQFISDIAFVHKVYYGPSSSGATGLYYKGFCAMMNISWAGPNTACIKSGMKSYMASMPMGPDATYFTNYGSLQFYAIPVTVDTPKEIAWLWTESCISWTEDLDMTPEFAEFYAKYFPPDWRWNAKPDKWITTEREWNVVMVDSFKYLAPDHTSGFPNFVSKAQSMIWLPIIKGEMSVAQAVDSAESTLQDILDQYK